MPAQRQIIWDEYHPGLQTALAQRKTVGIGKQPRNQMAKINISEFAAESAESINNGNLSHVIEQIDQLPKKQAMAAVAYIVNYLGGDEYHTGSFLRRLSDRL